MSPRTQEDLEKLREARKDHFRKVGLELFSYRGFHNTSIGTIARKAGVSKGLIYNYYNSKEELLLDIVSSTMNLAEDWLQEIEEWQEPGDKLRASIRGAFKFIEEQTDLSRMLMGLSIQPEAARLIQQNFKQSLEQQIGFYADLFEKLLVPMPREQAFLLGAHLDGMMVHYLHFQGSKDYPYERLKSAFIENYDQLIKGYENA